MTPTMVRCYQTYSDVVFMDATYCTNRHGLALAMVSGVSSEGRNVLLAVSFLAKETTEHYTWLLS